MQTAGLGEAASKHFQAKGGKKKKNKPRKIQTHLGKNNQMTSKPPTPRRRIKIAEWQANALPEPALGLCRRQQRTPLGRPYPQEAQEP